MTVEEDVSDEPQYLLICPSKSGHEGHLPFVPRYWVQDYTNAPAFIEKLTGRRNLADMIHHYTEEEKSWKEDDARKKHYNFLRSAAGAMCYNESRPTPERASKPSLIEYLSTQVWISIFDIFENVSYTAHLVQLSWRRSANQEAPQMVASGRCEKLPDSSCL